MYDVYNVYNGRKENMGRHGEHMKYDELYLKLRRDTLVIYCKKGRPSYVYWLTTTSNYAYNHDKSTLDYILINQLCYLGGPSFMEQFSTMMVIESEYDNDYTSKKDGNNSHTH